MKKFLISTFLTVAILAILLGQSTIGQFSYLNIQPEEHLLNDNTPPNPPVIEGPTSGEAGTLYSYKFTVTDPDNDFLSTIEVNWGDETTIEEDCGCETPWQSGKVVPLNHKWDESGSYTVQARVRDFGGLWSEWGSLSVSMPYRITLLDNMPPNPPVITGSTSGKIGEEYEYTVSVTDPENDDVYIWMVWGSECPAEEWLGPFRSGEKITLSNSWSYRGTFNVRALAKDEFEQQGEWGALEVSMSYFNTPLRNILYSMFQWIISSQP